MRVSPNIVMVCGKKELETILVGKDFKKCSDYDRMCLEEGASSSFGETNKRLHKIKVRLSLSALFALQRGEDR